jgi:hypothetical protein
MATVHQGHVLIHEANIYNIQGDYHDHRETHEHREPIC